MDEQTRVIALGFFDGVHKGHGALLHRTAEVAEATGARLSPLLLPSTPIPRT